MKKIDCCVEHINPVLYHLTYRLNSQTALITLHPKMITCCARCFFRNIYFRVTILIYFHNFF